MRKGVSLVQETVGEGNEARRGCQVSVDVTLRLNHGEIVFQEDNLTVHLGKRRVIAGLEYAIEGMRVGGIRTVRISPHLAYRESGVEGKVPPNAVLIADLLLRRVADA